MKKKIVIFGSNGMLGYVVATYFSEYYEVVAPTSDEFNILNTPINEVEKFLTDDKSIIEVKTFLREKYYYQTCSTCL